MATESYTTSVDVTSRKGATRADAHWELHGDELQANQRSGTLRMPQEGSLAIFGPTACRRGGQFDRARSWTPAMASAKLLARANAGVALETSNNRAAPLGTHRQYKPPGC